MIQLDDSALQLVVLALGAITTYVTNEVRKHKGLKEELQGRISKANILVDNTLKASISALNGQAPSKEDVQKIAAGLQGIFCTLNSA